ncbi:hypothetical protein HYFRA_00004367 [Hymenoscyphus fraxineus]|uniref:Cytochrome P450 n=1 Tax=Hymenoscyphus fraxineus TaxID=746836 RepID=A0A9N9PNU8_9HELO|nr:hypothetical protein HYFRA_00004367 [Hymenoscyphus fraxineus]
MSFEVPNTITFTAIAIVLSAVFWKLSKIGRRPSSYPPGPPTLPLIGNLHQIPNQKRHLQFEKWAQEYGPIYSLMLGTKVMIVLNSDLAIKDLIDKRGAIYSSRPQAYIAQDILSGGLRILFMVLELPTPFYHIIDCQIQTCGKWHANFYLADMPIQIAHRVLNISAARTYVPYQDLESKAMLLGFLNSPGDFINHLRRYSASLTTQMTFGFRTTSTQTKEFKEVFDVSILESCVTKKELLTIFEDFGPRFRAQWFSCESKKLFLDVSLMMAAFLDLVPMLRHIPECLLPIKKEGRGIHRRELSLFRRLYLQAKQGLVDGSAKPCVCVDLIKLQKEEEIFSDDLAAYLGGSLLQAGSETTSSILVGFIQAMTIFPDVVKYAQEELDRVCGDKRMPDLNDVPNLPYIRACAKESLRWMPGFTLGIPHSVTQDDTYMGYQIPSGSTVILNVWAVHNDPKRHPNPRQFDPMRYIGDEQTSTNSSNNPDATKRDHFVFGAGRRKCQGMHIADRSLFLAIGRLLWAFNFERLLDPETNQEIIPDMNDLAEGVMMLPKPFQTKITPRSAEKAECIRNEWGQMEELLDELAQWKVVPEGLVWGDEHNLE